MTPQIIKSILFALTIIQCFGGNFAQALPSPYAYRCVVTDVPAAYRQTPKRLITVVLKPTDKRIFIEMPKFQEGIEEANLQLETLKKKCPSIPDNQERLKCLRELETLQAGLLKDSNSTMYLSIQRNPMMAFDWRSFPEAQTKLSQLEPSILISVGSMESIPPDSSAIHELVRFTIPDGRDASISMGFYSNFESGAFRNYHLVCSRLDEKF